MILSREEILSANDLKREKVKVPEWGGEVFVSAMSGESRDEWEQSLVSGKGVSLTNIRARLFAMTACDEDGNRLFTSEDVQALGKKSGAALDRCVKVAQRLNRLTENDLEDLTKN
jgi:hypothetical protein